MKIIMKQMKGSMNEKLTAGSQATVPKSMIMPWIGGIKEPPTIAMTKNAAPKLLSSKLTFSKAMP